MAGRDDRDGGGRGGLSGRSVRFTFRLPGEDRPVGPPSMGAGVAEAGGSGIVLRFAFQTEDLAGASGPGGAKEAGLDVSEIRSVELKAGLLLGCRLVVEARDPAATVGIPGGGGGRVVLKVPRRERAAALLTAGLDREEAEGSIGGTGRGGSR